MALEEKLASTNSKLSSQITEVNVTVFIPYLPSVTTGRNLN